LVLLLAMSGCWWPGQGNNPDRTAFNDLENILSPDNVGGLAERWSRFNTDYGLTGGFVMDDPLVSSAGVHAPSGCELMTIAPRTGEVLWSKHAILQPDLCAIVVHVSTPKTTSAAVARDDRVLLSLGYVVGGSITGDHTTGTDAETGAVSGPEHGLVLSSLRGDIAAFRSFSGTVAGIGPIDDPAQVRTFVVDSTPSGTEAMTLGAEALYQAGPGPLATTTGDSSRGTAVRSYSRTDARPGCGPLPAGGTTLVECPLWVTPVDGTKVTAPVLGSEGTRIYVGTDAGTVYALDAAGDVQWSTPVGAAVLARPALAYGNLYVPTGDGRVVVLSAADGTTSWEAVADTTGAITEQPAVAGGVVFTGASDGWVRAFDAAGCGSPTCAPLWSDQVEPITGAPAVSRGQLYVGTRDGRIVAYGLP
jgi:outer membrane protein assembly factor BamB